jgi:putative DNA primase/helicase
MQPIDTISNALNHIPANIPRDEWVKVGMAIKSEYPDESGFELFDAWSQSGDNYKASDTKATWRSMKQSGGVTIGTLIHLAKENGFTLPKEATPHAVQHQPAKAHVASDRAKRQAEDEAQTRAKHEHAATEAAATWGAAKDTGQSPYLKRKGVQAFGVRFGDDGRLLVPLTDTAGKRWNIQTIAPSKVEGTPDKLFITGGRKKGLWHMLGELPSNKSGPEVVLIAEGYATAASLHQVTGKLTVCGFDAGNLSPVAKAWRARYPKALIVLCGDDDTATAARTGRNAGREKAEAAAKDVKGLAVFPEGLAEGETDFNDMHQRSGPEAVAAIIQGAIDKHQAKQSLSEKSASAGGGMDRFTVNDGDGVFYQMPGDDGPPKRVCGVLRVVALAHDSSDNQAAYLLEFETLQGKTRTWLMPLHMLAGDGAAYRNALLGMGFMCPTDAKRRAYLTEYLQSRNPETLQRIRHVPRVGWHGRCYVLPGETLGTPSNDESLIFHSEAGIEANFKQRGTLVEWRKELASLCAGNTRAVFAVCTAFAGPLLAWAPGTTGGGIHYLGQTSIGKTTCFLLAASVWGKGSEKDPESYIQKWRATSNGLEYQCEQHNDCTLILDELGQMDAGDAGASAYMMADGQGKTRGKGAGGLRDKPTWRLLFLSSGEISLAQHMETVGKRMKGGQEVRLIPLPCEVTPGSALENLHDFKTGHELSNHVQAMAAKYYGTAGRAWLEYLVDHTDGLASALKTRMDEIEALLVPQDAAGEVKRGGRRFALIAAAGEMATEAGITEWPKGEALAAAKACFNAWIKYRGGAGSSDKVAMLRHVRGFLEAHGEGRFSMWHRASDDHAPKTLHRAGVRRMLNDNGDPIKTNGQFGAEFGERMPSALGEGVSYEYFIMPEVFKTEVCKGFDVQSVCAVLKAHDCLKHDVDRHTYKQRLPSLGNVNCYWIKPLIFSLDI